MRQASSLVRFHTWRGAREWSRAFLLTADSRGAGLSRGARRLTRAGAADDWVPQFAPGARSPESSGEQAELFDCADWGDDEATVFVDEPACAFFDSVDWDAACPVCSCDVFNADDVCSLCGHRRPPFALGARVVAHGIDDNCVFADRMLGFGLECELAAEEWERWSARCLRQRRKRRRRPLIVSRGGVGAVTGCVATHQHRHAVRNVTLTSADSRKAKNKELHTDDGNGKGPSDQVRSAAAGRADSAYDDMQVAEAVFRSIRTYESERRRLDGPRRTLRARAAAGGLRVEDLHRLRNLRLGGERLQDKEVVAVDDHAQPLSFAAYLEGLRSGAWGDHLAILAAASVYKAEIIPVLRRRLEPTFNGNLWSRRAHLQQKLQLRGRRHRSAVGLQTVVGLAA
eukprot:gene35472-9191_t